MSKRISWMKMMIWCHLLRGCSTFMLTFSSMIKIRTIICNKHKRMLNQVTSKNLMVNRMGNLLTLIIQDKESKIFSMDYSEGICHLLFRSSILSKPKLMGSNRLNQTRCLEV